MLGLVLLEFRKLLGYRSVRISLMLLFFIPWIWSFAPNLQETYNLVLVSGWQMPALTLLTVMQFILPLLVGVTAAELLGAEVAAGTLSPLLMRPVERYKILGAKYVVALLYPLLLLAVLLVASVLAGARFGLGEFVGGTGFSQGGFAGVGSLGASLALPEILKAYVWAGATLAPVSGLSLLFSVVFLNTAAAALATISTLNIMRLFVVFPGLSPWLLTSYLEAYVADPAHLAKSGVMLLFYTLIIVATGLVIFERKDL
ncbi:MAG: ABC transporter permease [Deinococcaceae bacterium]